MEEQGERVPLAENTPFINRLFKRIVGLETIYFSTSLSYSYILKYQRDDKVTDYDDAIAGSIVNCHDDKSKLSGILRNLVAFYDNFVVIQHTETSTGSVESNLLIQSDEGELPENALYFITFICTPQSTPVEAILDMAPSVLKNLKESVSLEQ